MALPAQPQPLTEGQATLAGKIYKIAERVQERKITQVAAATRTGDAERSDQQYASEVIWDDQTGGSGVHDMDEREAPDRHYLSTMNTLSDGNWRNLPKRVNLTISGVDPLNWAGAAELSGYTYIVGDTRVKRISTTTSTVEYYSTATSAWVSSGGVEYALPGNATSYPIVWKGNLYVPCGTSGIARYNASAVTWSTIAVDAKMFWIFDEDLVRLSTLGACSSTDDTLPTTEWVGRGTIDTFRALKTALPHRNLAGEPAVWVMTDRGWLIHDYFAGRFYPSGLTFFDGDDSDSAAVTWDGDLYYGKDSNVHQVVNGARVVRGPAIGQGPAEEWRGNLVDFEPSFDNFLLAAFDGGGMNFSSVQAYNRKGWHMISVGVNTALYDTPTRLRDNFNRADSTTSLGTASHEVAETGVSASNVWTAHSGTWGVSEQAGYLVSNGGGTNLAATLLAGNVARHNDASTSVTLRTNASGARLLARYVDSSNYLYVENTGTGYKLGSVLAGVNTNLATYSCTPLDNDRLCATVLGTGVSVYLNGVEILTGTDANFSTTAFRFGIGSTSTTTPRFDDFSITASKYRLDFIHRTTVTTQRIPRLYMGMSVAGTSFLQYIEFADPTAKDDYKQALTALFSAIWLPRFDGGLADVTKTGLSVVIGLQDNPPGTLNTRIYYALDNSETFVETYDSAGSQSAISTGGLTTRYLSADKDGTYFKNIRLKIINTQSGSSVNPRISFIKLRYLREFETLYGHDVNFDLTGVQPDGRTALQAYYDLLDVVEGRKLVKLSYRSGETVDDKSVLPSVYGAQLSTGSDKTAEYVRVSFLEIVPGLSL